MLPMAETANYWMRRAKRYEADRDRWRRACLAACRRLADAESYLEGMHVQAHDLGHDPYAPDKCTTHHGTRPPK